MDDLYTQLETTREQGLKLLELLQRAALLGLLKTKVKAVKQMAAPEKMFLDNPNLMYAFNKNPETGTIRETFFYNQGSNRKDRSESVTSAGMRSTTKMILSRWCGIIKRTPSGSATAENRGLERYKPTSIKNFLA